METASLIVFKNPDGHEVSVMFRKYDGCPEKHGIELCKFLKGKYVINGIPLDVSEIKIENSIKPLAEMITALFKKKFSGVCLYPAGTRGLGEEYIYVVMNDELGQEPEVTVIDVCEESYLYAGSASKVFNAITRNME